MNDNTDSGEARRLGDEKSSPLAADPTDQGPMPPPSFTEAWTEPEPLEMPTELTGDSDSGEESPPLAAEPTGRCSMSLPSLTDAQPDSEPSGMSADLPGNCVNAEAQPDPEPLAMHTELTGDSDSGEESPSPAAVPTDRGAMPPPSFTEAQPDSGPPPMHTDLTDDCEKDEGSPPLSAERTDPGAMPPPSFTSARPGPEPPAIPTELAEECNNDSAPPPPSSAFPAKEDSAKSIGSENGTYRPRSGSGTYLPRRHKPTDQSAMPASSFTETRPDSGPPASTTTPAENCNDGTVGPNIPFPSSVSPVKEEGVKPTSSENSACSSVHNEPAQSSFTEAQPDSEPFTEPTDDRDNDPAGPVSVSPPEATGGAKTTGPKEGGCHQRRKTSRTMSSALRRSSAFSRSTDSSGDGGGGGGGEYLVRRLSSLAMRPRRRSSAELRASPGSGGRVDHSWTWTRLARRRSTKPGAGEGGDDDGRRRSSTSGARLVAEGGEDKGAPAPPSGLGGFLKAIQTGATRGCGSLARSCQKAKDRPRSILFPTLLTFSVLTATGLAVIVHSADQHCEAVRAGLLEQARDFARELDDVLSKALLPLFTLQEMAGQLEEFRTMPDAMIFNSTHPERAPNFRDGGRAFRNVTDLCMDPAVLDSYRGAAASIQESAKMGPSLLNVQLQPSGVVCLSHPRFTTYPNGMVVDHTGAIGLDRIHDSLQSASARKSIEDKVSVGVTGPITLVQDSRPSPHETLIYWAPIFIEGTGLETLDGATFEDYWGFAGVLVDWTEVMSEVGLYEFFDSRDMAFAIVEERPGGEDKVVVASAGDPLTRETAGLATPIRSREGWILLAEAPPPPAGVPAWEIWGSVLVVLGSALVSLALMTILVKKADHEELLCRCIPRSIVRRLHRGETVVERYNDATMCFIDIVSFTSMSGRMEAHEVMEMLEVLFREFDKLAVKHNCFNAETIGDAYLTISGGPGGEDGPTGAANIAAFSLGAVDAVEKLEFQGGKKIMIRLGVATGPVVAGVIGTVNVPKFTLFGETTSRAEEMESSGLPGKIQCHEKTVELLRSNFRANLSFLCIPREDGCEEAPEKTWWIVRPTDSNRALVQDDLNPKGGSVSIPYTQTLPKRLSSDIDGPFAAYTPEKRSFLFENYLLAGNRVWDEDKANNMNTAKNIKLRSIGNIFRVAVSNQRTLIITALTFAILLAVFLPVFFVFAKEYENGLRQNAIDYAKIADQFLHNELDKALLPLFATSELVKLLDKWYDLPFLINETPQFNKGSSVFNNVSDICHDPKYREPFVDIASSIKESSGMQGILVNVQLAPSGVLCLTHPKNNTEDFPPGVFLDTSGAVGLNLFDTENRAVLSKAAVKAERKTIQGPIKLVQGNLSVVDEALIARYPVYVDGHNITIDGENYPFWGFTIVLLDWDKLKSKFGIYEFFSRAHMEFRMTRFDTFNNRHVIIANSTNHEVLDEHNSISVPLESSDNAWTLIVGYDTGFKPPWLPWGTACVIIGSFLISLLVMMVLATSKMHKQLLYRMMPREAILQLEKGETFVERDSEATVFFSHLIGFQNFQNEMTPRYFLLMLTELYSGFDKLAMKHKCNKIESIGAYYIVEAPGPERCGEQERRGVERVALFALDLVDFVRNYQYKGVRVQIRCGFATGPIVAGAIGTGGLPKYTVFGDTVNFSSRMESTSRAMMIQCPHKSYKLLRESSEFDFQLEEREEEGEVGIFVKGKGQTLTFWVKGFTSAGRDVETSGDLVGTRDVAALGTDLVLDVETLCLGSDGKDKSVSFQVGACVQEK